ncbi:acetone carboxylase subunit gamma [Mycolicibacterium thermoresistibile]
MDAEQTQHRPIADTLVHNPADATFSCASCGHDLGAATSNYKERATLRETPMTATGSEFALPDSPIASKMVFREFFCPGCGLRLDTEISRAGDPLLHDIMVLSRD